MKKLIFYSLLSLSLFAVPSCGSDKEDEPIITVTGLNLDYTSITIEEGDTFTLTATVLPDNATDKTVLWTTGDASVATVSDGIVSALKGGVSWITAKAGDKIARCEVTVKPIIFTVTFDTDGGSDVSVQTVEKGKTATKPDTPSKAHVIFKGWYLDDMEYDFSTAVTSNITLKSHWWIPENFYVAKAFSVSETKQVYFASGNLQFHCKNKEWRFAPFQYDRVGYDNENISDDFDGYIDLFEWGTGSNPTFTQTHTTFSDWGNNIDNGNVWRTLTDNEWAYLITDRENASEKYGVAEVAGVQGLILLPDDMVLPTGLAFNNGVASEKGAEFYKKQNNYSADDWQKLESAGAVFLPDAGFRHGTSVGDVGCYGNYWSSSTSRLGARGLFFDSERIEVGNCLCDYGRSVRLVRPLE